MPPCCPAGKVPPRLPLGHDHRLGPERRQVHGRAGRSEVKAQRLDVNQSTTMANVPIVYMTCNAAAFAVGDRVIVEFQANDWTQPRVIGFVDYPKACAGGALYCIPADNSDALYGWSPPVADGEGNPINDGKGRSLLLATYPPLAGPLRDGTNRTVG